MAVRVKRDKDLEKVALATLVAELKIRQMGRYDMVLFLTPTYGEKIATRLADAVIHELADQIRLVGKNYHTTILGKNFNKTHFWIGNEALAPFSATELAKMDAAYEHKTRVVEPKRKEVKPAVVTDPNAPKPKFGTREWRILHGLKVKPLAEVKPDTKTI